MAAVVFMVGFAESMILFGLNRLSKVSYGLVIWFSTTSFPRYGKYRECCQLSLYKYTEAEVDIWIHNCDDNERQQIGLKFSDGR